MSAPGVLAVMDPQAELGVKQSTKNPNAGFVDWRDWCAYLGRANEARAKVAELIAAAKAVDESFHPATEARLRAAIAACGEQP